MTQVGEGAFAETRLTGFDSANGDLMNLVDRSTPDSATKAGTLTLNPNILRLSNNEHLKPSMATLQEIAADFADLVAGIVHSNHFGDNILLAAGDIDISADLAELMAQPMSTTTTQDFSDVMSPASIRHANRAMSVASAEDISDTVSDVSGDDVEEVMSEALNGPNFDQVNKKGKGKGVLTQLS